MLLILSGSTRIANHLSHDILESLLIAEVAFRIAAAYVFNNVPDTLLVMNVNKPTFMYDLEYEQNGTGNGTLRPSLLVAMSDREFKCVARFYNKLARSLEPGDIGLTEYAVGTCVDGNVIFGFNQLRAFSRFLRAHIIYAIHGQ